MSAEIVKALLPLNCRYNFHIESDGKCYSRLCMMNGDPKLKEKIAKQGCGVFDMPEVKALIQPMCKECIAKYNKTYMQKHRR